MLMESSHREGHIVAVENLGFIRGRRGFHFEPDFCGRMNVVLDDRSPDRVTFSCATELEVDEDLTISGGCSQTLQVRITGSIDRHYTAVVIDQG